MGKLSKSKKSDMFCNYCFSSSCRNYIECLEQRVSELEFELSKCKMKEITEDPIGYLLNLAEDRLPLAKERKNVKV